ncbi:MAG: M43 family zinc metalloprotease [Phycisphaerae bacterium]
MMRPLPATAVLAAIAIGAASIASAAPQRARQDRQQSALVDGQGQMAAASPSVRRYTIRHGDAQGVVSAGSTGRTPIGSLVYSNTTSSSPYSTGWAFVVADDARTTAVCDCSVSTLVVKVTGGGDGSTTPGPSIDYGLYANCPTEPGVNPIAGTSGTVVLPDDGVWVLEIDYSADPRPIPRNIWIGLSPSVGAVGWFSGSPPELGFSGNYYEHPLLGCETTFPPPVYASFYAQVYCSTSDAAPLPTNPSPSDTATDVDLAADLSWTSAAGRPAEGAAIVPSPASGVVEATVVDDSDGQATGGFGAGHSCTTYERWAAKNPQGRSGAGGCAALGICDFPNTRDAFIPDPGSPVNTIRLSIHVFCYDDGSGCVSTQTEVDAQIARLNLDYEQPVDWRIAFSYEVQFHNDTQYRDVAPADIDNMKLAYADSPTTKLNIYVANLTGPDLFSFATFPWDGDALTATGGIFMYSGMWSSGGRALAHEVGHCLGLWHTHHSPDEVSGCADPCYELAGSPSDTGGDLCSDTAPTPTNFACSDPAGTDPCTSPPVSWAPTNFRNYMSYSSCYTEWTPQQVGRGNCWSAMELSGWIEPAQCTPTYDVYLGTTNPPTTLICTDIEETTCDPGQLDCATTYYWQVVSRLFSFTTNGPIWSFDTIGGPDCNGNSTPDDCEIALGLIPDCQPNGVPDDCDITGGTSQDIDGNGIPDECMPPMQPLAPAAPPHDVTKNRYISIDPTTSGATPVAIEVQLASMKRCSGALGRTCRVDADCPGYCDNNPVIGCADDGPCGAGTCVPTAPCIEHADVGSTLGWVGAPYNVPEGCNPVPCGSTDWVAKVEQNPVYRVWTENPLHIGDCEIVPVATYGLRPTVDGVTYASPLIISTIAKPDVRHYGDTVGPVDGITGEYTPPDGFVNVNDIQAYVLTVQNYPAGSPYIHRTWVDMHGNDPGTAPNYIANVSDLTRVKFGFEGRTYTETPEQENPGNCP